MRSTYTGLIYACLTLSACAAPAPTPPAPLAAADHTVIPVPAAPAPRITAAPGAPSVDWVSIGTLLADPRGKAVLHKDLPELAKSRHIREAKAMTLQDIGPFSHGVIDDAKLQKIQADLNVAYASRGPSVIVP